MRPADRLRAVAAELERLEVEPDLPVLKDLRTCLGDMMNRKMACDGKSVPEGFDQKADCRN